MYYCTTSYFEERQDHFVCSNYRSNTGSCSAHFIRAVVLEKMVWEHLKEVIWYVGHYESHFRSIMESRLQAESKETIRVKRMQLEKDEKRIAELDRLFIRLYEDNVASWISDDRFAMMSWAYEEEQRELILISNSNGYLRLRMLRMLVPRWKRVTSSHTVSV